MIKFMGKVSVCAAALASLAMAGCSDSDGADGAGGQGGAAEEGPVYGIGTLVTDNAGSNDYLLLRPDLELSGEELTLDDAREFAGQSDLATRDGFLLVSSGDGPEISKYRVLADRSLEAEGEAPLSFAEHGMTSAAFWNNQFVAEDKAYMVNGPTELVVWNPQTMELVGTIEIPELEEREGLRVVAGLADRSSIVHDGKFYLPLYWTDENYAQRSDDSVVVVVDVASGEVSGTISVPCPGMDYVTKDDDGTLYFSNWTGGVGTHYVLGTAQNCVAAIDPATEEVTVTNFADITGGHEGAAFLYAGEGRFVLSVFDEVRADIENAEDPFTPVAGLNWQLWSYDPASGDAAPIESIDWNSGAIIHQKVDGDVYSMVPGADYGSTKVYRSNGVEAEPAFDITGWSFRMFRVR